MAAASRSSLIGVARVHRPRSRDARVAAVVLALAFGSAASADTFVYVADLRGANMSIPNDSPASGAAIVTIDTDLMSILLQLSFSGLQGVTVGAAVHCCTVTAGEANSIIAVQSPSLDDFPVGVTAGSYERAFDATLAATYNGAFLASAGGVPAAALQALLVGLDEGKAYLNIRDSYYLGGAIRGFFVPEADASAATAAAVTVLAGLRRARRRPRSARRSARRGCG